MDNWSYPKNYSSVRMSQGNLVVTKVLGGFFVSSESVSYPHGSRRKFEACFHRKLYNIFFVISFVVLSFRSFKPNYD